jgi:hypothetical protein
MTLVLGIDKIKIKRRVVCMDYQKFSKKKDTIEKKSIEENTVSYKPAKDQSISVAEKIILYEPVKEPSTAAVVAVYSLNIREKPDIDSNVLCVAEPHSHLLVENIIGDWAHVYTEQGIEGYAKKEYIILSKL